ncbi:MAG: hypothetical protein EKK55_06680 [Rhodocyclaceae bacterium]|nr:MAG: hypothetical protein EKK55_06680 [Rhodocyclaceae bacterium]
MSGGFTSQQLAAIDSLPNVDFFYEREGHPYMPPGVAALLLNAIFGADGWGMEIRSVTLTQFPVLGDGGAVVGTSILQGPFATRDRDKVQYWMEAEATVRLSLGYRDDTGHLTGDVKVMEGTSGHRLAVNQLNNVAQALGNLRQGAVSRALRAAVQMLGPVFGTRVIKIRKDSRGRPNQWRHLCQDGMPPFPSLPGCDSAANIREIDEEIRRAQLRADGSDDDEIDDDVQAAPTQEVTPSNWAPPTTRQAPAAPAPRQQPQQPQQAPAAERGPAQVPIHGNRPAETPPDGKPYFVEWQLNGAQFGRFSGDGAATATVLMKRGANVRVSWRQQEDAEYERQPEQPQQGQPAQQPQPPQPPQQATAAAPADLLAEVKAALANLPGAAATFTEVTGAKPILFGTVREDLLREFLARVQVDPARGAA